LQRTGLQLQSKEVIFFVKFTDAFIWMVLFYLTITAMTPSLLIAGVTTFYRYTTAVAVGISSPGTAISGTSTSFVS